MLPGLTTYTHQPQKDPEIGAYRCRQCGVVIFRAAWLCDDCAIAARRRMKAVFRACLLVAAIGFLVAVVAIVVQK